MKLGDFNAKVGREKIFKLAIWKVSLHQDISYNGVRSTLNVRSLCRTGSLTAAARELARFKSDFKVSMGLDGTKGAQ